MMFGIGSFNLINEFEQASNEQNAEQLASSLARLQSYLCTRSLESPIWFILILFIFYF